MAIEEAKIDKSKAFCETRMRHVSGEIDYIWIMNLLLAAEGIRLFRSPLGERIDFRLLSIRLVVVLKVFPVCIEAISESSISYVHCNRLRCKMSGGLCVY